MIDLSQFKRASEPKKEQDLDLSQFKRKERSIKEHISHIPEYLAEGGYGAILGAPRTITGAMEFASRFPNKKRFISAALAKPEEFLKKIGVPTQEEATKQAQKRTGTSEFEEHPIQKGTNAAGSIATSALLTPGASFGTPAKAGITALASIGGGIGAGLEGGAAGEIGGAIGLPALVTAMAALKTGKFSPSTKQLRQLYEEGKNLGLTDKEMAPILQSRFKKKLIGKLAQPTERAEAAIETSESALGNIYDKLKTSTKKMPRSNQKQDEEFFHSIGDIIEDLQKSKMPPADKEFAIKKMDKMMNDVIEGGINPAEIIATWQDINQSVNWNSFKGGKKVLGRVKEPLSKLFGELAPSEYKKFKVVNDMWGKLQDTASRIKPHKAENYIKLGKWGALAHGVYNLVTTGSPKHLLAVAGTIATEKGARLLATEMLINPRLNNLINKTLSGLASNSDKTKMFYLKKFQNELKEFPEINKEFDFPEDQELESKPSKSP
jgi:hypothetical protein